MAAPPHLRLVTDSETPGDMTTPHDAGLTIDCDICVVRESEVCDDCVVSYLVGHELGKPVFLSPDEKRAVELLADAGLVPGSRFAPRPGVA